MNYASINSNPQQTPPATPQAFEFLKIASFKISAPAAKLVFQYPTQVLDLIVNFFKR